jgi:hypothetical protein
MPLNWHVGNIKNSDDVCWITATHDSVMNGRVRGQEYLNPITDHFIWATMTIGLNEITEKNIDEWEQRLALAYRVGWLSKPVVWNGNEPDADGKNAHCFEARPLTRADLERHIGLSTNASYETAGEWRKRLVEQLTKEGLREAKHDEKRNEELDAIWQKESIELRDRIRRGEITKEEAAKEVVAV